MDYGVCSPEQMSAFSGREFLQKMIDRELPAPTMARTLGFRLVEIDHGRAVFEAEPGPHLLNPLGGVHGGWALTLIDSAAGCAVHSRLQAGVGYATVETKTNMTRAIGPDDGTVRCEGRVLSFGRQIATAEATLTSASGKLLAHGTSTLIILHARA